MTRFILSAVLSVALLGVHVGVGMAQTSEEQELHTMNQHLDEEAVGKAQSSKMEALSHQFKVEPKIVENLRANKQGWGEIAIRLGIAQELTKVDPKMYPTMTEALQKVGDLRAQKMGWGGIAKSLGFKLGPIVSEVKHTRNELRKAEATEDRAKAEKVKDRDKDKDVARLDREHKVEKMDKGEKMERMEKMDKIEKMERAERFERVEKPMRPERPEKPERFK